jgi:hypothetical protein
MIWNCLVPPKVKLLAWKNYRNGLAMQESMARRRMLKHGEEEDGGNKSVPNVDLCLMTPLPHFHTLPASSHPLVGDQGRVGASCGWSDSHEVTQLTGTKWLIRLLTTIYEMQQAQTIMVLWPICHNHNEMTHAKPYPSIEGSNWSLISCLNSLLFVKQYPTGYIFKGNNGHWTWCRL